jgi:endonuclease-3
MDKKKRVKEILLLLKKEIPAPRTALKFSSPFELLVATILSAQCTDVQVNRVTGELFRKYRSVKAFANAPLNELQKDVSSINFYKNKAKNIQAAARMIIEEFRGKVPQSIEEMVKLPGVARKTANIVLAGAFGIEEGIAVDTHVKRLANRLGLTTHDDSVKIEQDLLEITPKKDRAYLSHLLILYGRSTCKARNPRHGECVLRRLCPSRNI